ncbi:penicillin-binding protein 1C [Usitatibacter palustris]|uniref:peptidoglycan glycosyltransferase n=1 Tax=Usitatibacter palustris TaxID=2732487 RepID=A0A6M4H638_9PROT|nr:penicillin-binding protein 1C [Usitatibacter palustris]QJR15086.1 Biosynthetic peptidoglycan transglycosylase [Usitatibacter palustris]
MLFRSVTLKRFACATFLGVALASIATVLSLAIAPYPVVDLDAVRLSWRSADAWLLDRHGQPLSKVRVDHKSRRGEWVGIRDVSPSLIEAVISTEDKRFRQHEGVDWLGMMGAAKQSTLGERRGGSTITMQLAAHLNPELEMGGQRGFIDKWRQMRQALAIERMWTKEQVLEAWLNLTPFRGEIEGVDAASRALAGKRPAGLDRGEAAILTALVRAPNAPAVRVARRACAIFENDELACRKAERIASEVLAGRHFRVGVEGDAPHAARRLLKESGQLQISSLDARTQRFARDSLARHLRELEGRNVQDGAVVVLDNKTGEVLAYVGSSGELSRSADVDGAAARRQAGSTLKPFLYELAIEERMLTAASILDDSPLAITTAAGLYVPQNYDRSFKGPVSLRVALAGSLNVPAVRTLGLIGYQPFHARLRALGLDTLDRDAEHYGYGLALGGGEVTLLQLTNAYRALANHGEYSPVRFARSMDALPHRVVMDPTSAFIISDVLADSGARAITFGLASPLSTRYRASVKTGTSKDMRDNWAVGYTEHFTVGVWVGNFAGDAMHDVSGVTGAAPVWRDVMDFMHANGVPGTTKPPEGVIHASVRFANGLEPDREEWFVAGTQAASITAVATPAGKPRLEAPANGAIFALDPDIPGSRQRIVLRARGAEQDSRFVLPDGRKVAAAQPFLWNPAPGRHRVALVDGRGAELDHASFEVRK